MITGGVLCDYNKTQAEIITEAVLFASLPAGISLNSNAPLLAGRGPYSKLLPWDNTDG
jgi:hypothetical protein